MSTLQVPAQSREHVAELTRVVRRLKVGNNIATGVLWVVAAFVALLFIAIIIYLLARGGAYLLAPQLYGSSDAGLGREIFNSFYILILTEIFLFPIALAAAIYLIEYARPGPLVTSIHFAAETLTGVPSIVLGLFGVAAFSDFAHMGTSRLAGALALLCLNLPLALRLFEDALAAVPRELREGGEDMKDELAGGSRRIQCPVTQRAKPYLPPQQLVNQGDQMRHGPP